MADRFDELAAFCEKHSLIALAWDANEVDAGVVMLAETREQLPALTAQVCGQTLVRLGKIEEQLQDLADHIKLNILALPPSAS